MNLIKYRVFYAPHRIILLDFKLHSLTMGKNTVLYLILIVFFLTQVQSYTSVNIAWTTNPYFRADNSKVINSNTNGGATRTRTFWFSSWMSGTPQIAYGIKSFKGTDRLYETNFEIKQVSLSSSQFRVSVELFGTSSMWMLQVQYFAVDPSFPFHMNTFPDMPIQYGSTLTNITTSSSALTTFTQIINYSSQSAGNTFKTFTSPMNYNKIVYYLTSMRLTANTSAPFKLDVSYSILNTTHYSLTASVFHYGTVNNLRLSLIIYNDYDIEPSDQFEIINYDWVDDGTGSFYSVFPEASQDNMICGLSSFGTDFGNCALDYQWDYNNNIPGSLQSIELSRSKPSANSSTTCGQNYVKSTLFYIKSWDCPNTHKYYNETSVKCQNACASYFYYNTTALTCTPCYYACYNCSLPASKTSCSQCETGLERYLIGNTCRCSTGYFDDGFEPGCKACADVDPKSLSCTYAIDPLQPTSYYENIFNQTTWATDILPNFTSITCVTAYFINTSRLCQACPSNCITCTDSVTCTSCNTSLSAILYSDNLCYLCNLANCLSCYPDNICVSCSSPLVVSEGVCMTCVQACVCNGWVLPKINGTCSTLCGDGIKVGPEECDDGNLNDHDGCSSTCTLEPCNVSCLCDGWASPWETSNSSCTTVCGDGLKRGNQQCDDGNLFDHDGCSSICTNEPCEISCLCNGWVYPWLTTSCSTLCGDGIKVGLEECDDGNTDDHDGCSSTCTLEPCSVSCLCNGWTHPWIVQNSTCSTVCGDGFVRGVEQCDDGNLYSGDGCDYLCIVEPPLLLTESMSQYPALVIFALGFRIVGLEALHVIQSFQLIVDSISLYSFRISFNIHGYTDKQNFPIHIPNQQNFLSKFNFMYFIVVGFFVIGIVLEIYNLCCHKANKVLDSYKQNSGRNPTKNQHSQVDNNSDGENGDDFAVHYKGQSKLKANQSQITPPNQSSYLPKQQQKTFWGILVFRQIFFNLVINLLSVFAYSFADQIKNIKMASFSNIQSVAVLITMIIFFILICLLFVFKSLTFGQSLLKFNKGQVLEYWILLIGEKIVFSAILGTKSFWNLEVILVLKFFLLTYYWCSRIYFEHLQKVRSVVTHLIHFMLIFAVIISEHIFKPYGLYETFPRLFMEYIFLALLCLVLFICFVYYIREMMHSCQADLRQLDESQVSQADNLAMSAVFDVKNIEKMQESAQQLAIKGHTSIMDEIKTKKNIRNSSDFLDVPTQASHLGVQRKFSTSNDLNNYPMSSATSLMGRSSAIKTKNNLQSNIKGHRKSDMMSVVQMQEQNQIQEIDMKNSYQNSPGHERNQSGVDSQDIKIKLNNSTVPDGHTSNSSYEIQPPKGFKNYANKLVLKNKNKLKNHDKNYNTDVQKDMNELRRQSGQRFDPSYETDDPLSRNRRQSKQMTFHKNKDNNQNYSEMFYSKTGDEGNKGKLQIHDIFDPTKTEEDDHDATSINLN